MTPIRPDLLSSLPGLVVARVSAALPDLAQCSTMAGKLDLSTLKSISARAPAVLVSHLGIGATRAFSGPEWHYSARLAAFVLTRDRPGLQRDVAAANIVQVLMSMIPGATWGVDGQGPA